MDNMLGENQNLKVTEKDPAKSPSDFNGTGTSLMSVTVSYRKTNKLITALYMVTDIMDKDEPLRSKLRTLGVSIISDMHSLSLLNIEKLVNEVLSLLDIAFSIGMISEMNSSILKKEFIELKQSIQKSKQEKNNPTWLQEFFTESPLLDEEGVGGGNSQNHYLAQGALLLKKEEKNQKNSIGRIGVQKGSTLMKALSNIQMSDKNISSVNLQNNSIRKEEGYDLLKKKRREIIIKIIKDIQGGASIKDIVFGLRTGGEEWGEKTLQRELVSMVHDSVLDKTGEKRWSRYFIKK